MAELVMVGPGDAGIFRRRPVVPAKMVDAQAVRGEDRLVAAAHDLMVTVH
jgi:hypothetical protein